MAASEGRPSPCRRFPPPPDYSATPRLSIEPFSTSKLNFSKLNFSRLNFVVAFVVVVVAAVAAVAVDAVAEADTCTLDGPVCD